MKHIEFISRKELENDYTILKEKYESSLKEKYTINKLLFITFIIGIIYFYPGFREEFTKNSVWSLWLLFFISTIYLGIICRTSWLRWKKTNNKVTNFSTSNDYEKINSESLNFLMNEAIKNEDYEIADKINKILLKRTK